jgi:hypothetical protein
VTWDVDSKDRRQCGRVRRFIFGDRSSKDGRIYEYEGFVHREGVRYLGQSVLFVDRTQLQPLVNFLRSSGVDPVVTEASLGSIVRV